MAQSKEDIKTKFPLPVYNYRVTILGEDEASTISFSEVTGLSVEYEPIVYKHGFSCFVGNIILPGMRQPIRVTLRKGIVKGNDFLNSWLNKTYSNPSDSTIKRDIIIDLCDESGAPVVRWKVQKALPVKQDASDFNASNSEVAIESLELIAHGLTVDYDP